MSHVVMVAAENAALRGGKVGGMADVVGELPPALMTLGYRVSTIVPSHGVLHKDAQSKRAGTVATRFRGEMLDVEVYLIASGKEGDSSISHWVLHHDELVAEPEGAIYAADPPGMPFATDASRFALFSRAAVNLIANELMPPADVIHCHDWHTGFVAILREYDSGSAIADIPLVFTIHNLAYQGVRPFDNDASSLSAWYSDIGYDGSVIGDPRWPHCVNPMLAGIRLSDRVHVVSPTYATEILRADDAAARGFYGGAGLENVLQEAQAEGKLVGILNGCDYPETESIPVDWSSLCEKISSFISGEGQSSARVDKWRVRKPEVIVTSVTRVASQKLGLALAPVVIERNGEVNESTAIEHILNLLGDDGVFVLLGSGDADMERQLNDIASRYENFIFVNGFSSAIADDLYAAGNLFLMPSGFEPCGLSQMLAMREGQPCLVHAVGGLKDTVMPNVNGFAFSGDSVELQAQAFVRAFDEALTVFREVPEKYAVICAAARVARFLWPDTAKAYIDLLYKPIMQTRKST